LLQRPALDQPNSKAGSECVTCRQANTGQCCRPCSPNY
jgi:hypothetical protein